MFSFGSDLDEMCYPFIYEHSSLCDFELLTDELCTQVGLAGSACSERDSDIAQQLFGLQAKMFDLNGSIRGRCAIAEDDIVAAKSFLAAVRAKLLASQQGFVLPRGTGVVVMLHYCRSLTKKIIRALVRIDQEEIAVPSALPRYTNVLTNLFFALAQQINERDQVPQPAYISNNYGKK